MQEEYEYSPLRKQNFRLIGWVCLVGALLVLVKTFFAAALSAPLTTGILVCEHLTLAWVMYQLGIYVNNFDKSPMRVYMIVFVVIILSKAAYILTVSSGILPRYQGAMLLFNTLYISLYLISGRYIMRIDNDFVGGLKYIGVLFITKAIVIFVRLLASVAETYTPVISNIGRMGILATELLLLFVDFAILYILFKIFRKADLTQ